MPQRSAAVAPQRLPQHSGLLLLISFGRAEARRAPQQTLLEQSLLCVCRCKCKRQPDRERI